MAESKQKAAEPEVVAKQEGSNDAILAVLATMGLIGLIMYLAMPDASPRVRHYSKQGIALLVVSIPIFFVSWFPFLGQLLLLALMILWIVLAIKAFQGNELYAIPVVGDYFDKKLK